MNHTTRMLALFIGSVGIMGPMSAHALTLNNGDLLPFTAGAPVLDSNGDQLDVTGSWFAMDLNGDSRVQRHEKIAISMGTTGIVIGASNTSLGVITSSWPFNGSTGYNFVTTAITGGTTSGLDFSGWHMNWSGSNIFMGTGAWTPQNAGAAGMASGSYINGVANFSASYFYSGNPMEFPVLSYTLDYTATVPWGVFSGTRYALHLEAAPVPEASTYGMMLAGLGLVGATVATRRKHTSI